MVFLGQHIYNTIRPKPFHCTFHVNRLPSGHLPSAVLRSHHHVVECLGGTVTRHQMTPLREDRLARQVVDERAAVGFLLAEQLAVADRLDVLHEGEGRAGDRAHVVLVAGWKGRRHLKEINDVPSCSMRNCDRCKVTP